MSPLDATLAESYRELQELAAKVGSKLDVDEMLNDILMSKVGRVQELARVLAAPELYVEQIKKLKPREIAKMISYRRPVLCAHLEPSSMAASLKRVMDLIEAMSREPPEDPVPQMTIKPEEITLRSEDAVFSEELERFLDSFTECERIAVSDLIRDDDKEVSLRRFIFVIVLISDGSLDYFPEDGQVAKSKPE